MILSRNNDGFTLMEIMIVIIIVGVMAGLALPRMTGTVERSKTAEGVNILTALLGAQKAFWMENSAYATNINQLDVDIDRASNFNPASINIRNNSSNVASIDRNGGLYTLSIDEDGVISCAGAGCPQAGY